MDWSVIPMFHKPEEKKTSGLKVVLIIIGAVVAVAGVLAVLYTIFKKYFTITFECGDCDTCEEDCFPADEAEEDELSVEEEETAAPEEI